MTVCVLVPGDSCHLTAGAQREKERRTLKQIERAFEELLESRSRLTLQEHEQHQQRHGELSVVPPRTRSMPTSLVRSTASVEPVVSLDNEQSTVYMDCSHEGIDRDRANHRQRARDPRVLVLQRWSQQTMHESNDGATTSDDSGIVTVSHRRRNDQGGRAMAPANGRVQRQPPQIKTASRPRKLNREDGDGDDKSVITRTTTKEFRASRQALGDLLTNGPTVT
eukprot:COSAG01_NODE_4105_length_5343_cov_91.963577_6_plen_223_part_00